MPYIIFYQSATNVFCNNSIKSKIDVKKIKCKRCDYYRIRLGDYRVVYTVINSKIVVDDTILARSRDDVYKKMSGLK